MRSLSRALVTAAAVCLPALSARADLPPSLLIHLVYPVGGAVVSNAPGAKIAFSFSVNWAEINKKYAAWGGAKNLFMAIGMHADVPGAGVMLGDFIVEGQSSKTWAVSDILAAMAQANIPPTKRLFWNVIIRPHNTANPDTTDRTEDTFGIGAAPAPTAVVVSANPELTIAPKISVANATGERGEKKKLSADVKQAGVPVAGLTLTFTVGGLGAGTAVTDANGKATVSFTIPGNFLPKAYEIRVTAPHLLGTGELTVVPGGRPLPQVTAPIKPGNP